MEKPKAVFLDAHTLDPGDNDMSILENIVDLTTYPRTHDSEIIERSRDADILIVNKCRIERETIEQVPGLKLIQVAATGYNNVDIQTAAARNIPVCNISGYSTSSVAQQVFAMLLSYFNQTMLYNQEVSEGKWTSCKDFSYWHSPIRELSGKTMGILGYGDIGKAVSRIALSFGMQVIVSHTRKLDEQLEVRFVDQEEMFREADIISLHAPLNEGTRHIIDNRRINIMKPQAVLVNTARGGLVNNMDLKNALEQNRIAAALLDVLDKEPPDASHPLINVKNCYITPHQAWASLESRQRLLAMLHENIAAFLSGKTINQVNA